MPFSDETLAKVVADILEISAAEVTDELSSDTCPNWDSVRHLSVILAVEETFGIMFDENEFAGLMNYRDLRRSVLMHLG